MHVRLVIPVLFLPALAVQVLCEANPSGAADLGGQNTSAGGSASGGQVTVVAASSGSASSSGPAGGAGGSNDGFSGEPNPYQCSYTAVDPAEQQFLGPGGPTPGEWVIYACPGTAVAGALPLEWLPTTEAQAAAPVNVTALGQQAVSRLGLGSPAIDMAPPSGSPQLVNVATWLWINPGAWQTLTATASAGTVTATATATPAKVVWNMGDGNQVICSGPGTAYRAADPGATTDCSYTWTQGGNYQVTATVYWSVTWAAVGAPGGGNLGEQAGPGAQVPVTVTESQAINTSSGGN
jgi:hypothetical protein